jgi:hypothetical protein
MLVTHKQIRTIVRCLSGITTYGWMDGSKVGPGLYNICFYGSWPQHLVDTITEAVRATGYRDKIKVTGNGSYLRFYRVGAVD